jgi:uroporphyrinogen decarboxylase
MGAATVTPGCRVRGWIDWTRELGRWPTGFWRHYPIADQAAATLAEATLSFQRRMNFDIVKVTPAGTYQTADYGLVHAWKGDSMGRREIVGRPVREWHDWEPALERQTPGPSQRSMLEAARLVSRATTSGATVLHTVFTPLTQAVQLAGIDTVREHMRRVPREVERVLERLTADTVRLIAELPATGVDGVYLAAQTMNLACFSTAEYQRWGMPYDLACITSASALARNVIHVHGESVHFAMPELDANWALHYELARSNPSLEEGLKATAGPVFPGLPVADLLAARTVKTRVETLRTLAGRLGGKTAAVCAGCCLPLDFPERAAAAWGEAVRAGSM